MYGESISNEKESISKEFKMAIDPVCKMEVDESSAAATSEYKGETYYFCAPGCKASFDKEPEKYLTDHAGHEHHEHH